MFRETNLLRAQLLIEAADLLDDAEVLDEGFSNDVRRDLPSEMLHSKSKLVRDKIKADNPDGLVRIYSSADGYKKYHEDDARGTSVKDFNNSLKDVSPEDYAYSIRQLKDKPTRFVQKITSSNGNKVDKYLKPRKKIFDEM